MQRRVSSGSLTGRRFRKRSPARRGSMEVGKGKGKGRDRPAAPTPRAGAGARRVQEWLPEESSGDGDDSGSEGFGRSASLKSNASARSFPTTIRGSQPPSRKRAAPKGKLAPVGSILHRGSLHGSASGIRGHRRRASDSDVPMGSKHKALHKPLLASGGVARLSQSDFGDSVNSLTTSELESIAEDDTMDLKLKRVPAKILEDSDEEDGAEDTFEFARKGGGEPIRGVDTHNKSTSGKGKQLSSTSDSRLSPSNALAQPSITHNESTHARLHSPSRASFSLSTLETTPPKHSPPPRSVSPAKSALKHVDPSSPSRDASRHATIIVPASKIHSEAGSVQKGRVSFSDEDSIASFSAYSRPPLVSGLDDTPRKLPVFGSAGRGGAGRVVRSGMVPAVLAPSPPTSNSGEEGLEGADTGSVVRWPRGRAPLGKTTTKRRLVDEVEGKGDMTTPESTPERTVNVPELVLIIPTPMEKKQEEDGALSHIPGSFPSGPEENRHGHGLCLSAVAGGGRLRNSRASAERDSDSDSFSGDSIYSDAYEDLTTIPARPEQPAPTIPNILEVLPLSAVRPRNDSSSLADPALPLPNQQKETRNSHVYEEDPPLPPDFLKSSTARNTAANGIAGDSRRTQPMPIQRQYSSSSSSTVTFSDGEATDDNDTASVLSESSFRRIRPRERRTGMMSSMRTAPPTSYDPGPSRNGDTGKLSKRPTAQSSGMRSSLRNGARKPAAKIKSRFTDSDSDSPAPRQKVPFRSRFAGDSDDDLPGGAGGSGSKLRKRTNAATTNGTIVKERGERKRLWGMFSKKGKKKSEMASPDVVENILAGAGAAGDKEMGRETLSGKGVIVKKSKAKPTQQGRGSTWAGGTQGETTSVIPGGPAVAKEVGMGDERLGVMGLRIEGGDETVPKRRKKFMRLRRILGFGN